jgi:hypothetical protein
MSTTHGSRNTAVTGTTALVPAHRSVPAWSFQRDVLQTAEFVTICYCRYRNIYEGENTTEPKKMHSVYTKVHAGTVRFYTDETRLEAEGGEGTKVHTQSNKIPTVLLNPLDELKNRGKKRNRKTRLFKTITQNF